MLSSLLYWHVLVAAVHQMILAYAILFDDVPTAREISY
jgi:hypothetical protein